MNRCLSFNEGTAIRGDARYSVDVPKGATTPITQKFEGPSEHSEKFGD
jgi:hypothetical protein